MAKSKGYNKPIVKASASNTKEAATSNKKNSTESISYRWDLLSGNDKFKLFWGAGVGLLLFFFFWFKPVTVNLIDPWYNGTILLDSAQKVQDPTQKAELIAKGGALLREQVNMHPYHARLHYLYGYYYYVKQDWDSCVIEEKKAIDIGAGGIVNQVEYQAAEMLNAALGNKLNAVMNTNPELAKKYIQDAVSPRFYNFTLDKYRGMLYTNTRQYDSSRVAFRRFLRFAPNDYDVLYNMAVSFAMSNQKDSAIYFASMASQVNPQNPTAQNLINQLNASR